MNLDELISSKKISQNNMYIDETKKKCFLDKNYIIRNKEIASILCMGDSSYLEHCSNSFKMDKDFVLGALRENGHYLKECPNFKNDLDICICAINNNNSEALEYVGDELKNTPRFENLIIDGYCETNGYNSNYFKSHPGVIYDHLKEMDYPRFGINIGSQLELEKTYNSSNNIKSTKDEERLINRIIQSDFLVDNLDDNKSNDDDFCL